MSETPLPAQRPLSRIRGIVLIFIGIAAFLTFVVPWLLPVSPHPFYLMLVVLFGPPLLPLRLRYKLLVFVGLILVGPFLLAMRPLEGTSPARQLASAESRFFNTGQIEIHYQVAGTGEPTLMLLHPGQPSGLGTWRKVMPALSGDTRVVAFDRPGAGLTAWPANDWPKNDRDGESPYSSEAQADQTVALMDHLGVDKAVLVGNSAGGTVALLTALRHPGRVSGLVLIAPGVYFGMNDGSPAWVRHVLATPQGRRLGRLLVRATGKPGPDLWASFWHDPSKQEPEDEASYLQTFSVDHWDLAFLELFRTARPLGLPERLAEVRVPVLVVTGDHDQWVPMGHNEQLTTGVPDGRLEVIADCGHLPQQEQPQAFVQVVRSFVRNQSSP